MALVKYNNNSISAVTSAASVPSGALTLIKTLTASSSATLSFVHGASDVVLDSTYPIYVFKFINIHPASDGEDFQFNMSIDSGSNYNVTKTSTWFYAYNSYAISGLVAVEYNASFDLAQGTGDQILTNNIGNDNDQSASGSLFIYNPSSTTFVKHFIARTNIYHDSDHTFDNYIAGYFNTTSAITGLDFKMSSGNIDSGVIKMYGISK